MALPSYTTNYFSKEDEIRELNELTRAEKEEILDDKYGRNMYNRNSNNDAAGVYNNNEYDVDNPRRDDDVSDELLRRFYSAVDEIPLERSAVLLRAMAEAEDTVIRESHPVRFLRRENYNPEMAALRQCEYWNTRYEIFGEEDAFDLVHEVISLDPDVIRTLVQIPNFFRMLPNDDHGRTVVCLDRTGIRLRHYDDLVLLKIVWFVFHKALEKPSTQENGIVLIIIDQVMLSCDFASLKFLKYFNKSLVHAIPVNVRCCHGCLSSLVSSFVVPFVKYNAKS